MNLKEKPVVKAENPKTEEYTMVRNWLLPSLMEVLSNNKRHAYPQNLFEVGDVVTIDETTDVKNRTIKKLCVVLCHSQASFSEIKSLTETLLDNLGVKNYRLEETKEPYTIEGRTAKILSNGKELGICGEIHPSVLEKWELEMPVAAMELDINSVFELLKKL